MTSQTYELSNSDADASDAAIEALCASAKSTGTVVAVCVHPNALVVAKTHLAGSPVKLAAILNTQGTEETLVLEQQAASAVLSGADEIEMVMPTQIFASGRPGYTETQILRVKRACNNLPLKVVLEKPELTNAAEIEAAASLALEAGADLLKTTSGDDPATTEILQSAILGSGHQAGLRVNSAA